MGRSLRRLAASRKGEDDAGRTRTNRDDGKRRDYGDSNGAVLDRFMVVGAPTPITRQGASFNTSRTVLPNTGARARRRGFRSAPSTTIWASSVRACSTIAVAASRALRIRAATEMP